MNNRVIDARTLARDVPGLFEIVFPGLTPGLVAHYNSTRYFIGNDPINDEEVRRADINAALLFEIACVRTDRSLLDIEFENPEACLEEAWHRQSKFYDARHVSSIGNHEWNLASRVSDSLLSFLRQQSRQSESKISSAPLIHGYQWIGNSRGDYSIGNRIIEVKCSAGNFSGADYRQVLIYWMLSLISEIEGQGTAWKEASLINPRRCVAVDLDLENFLVVAGRGASKVEMVQRFASVIGERANK